MSKNPFSKSRKTDEPYAIYHAGGIVWHVLKTYKLVKNEDAYARHVRLFRARRYIRARD